MKLIEEDEYGVSKGIGAGSGDQVEDKKLKKKLREMEEEQEELNSSLMAMTSHFAKVKSIFNFKLQKYVLEAFEILTDIAKAYYMFYGFLYS